MLNYTRNGLAQFITGIEHAIAVKMLLIPCKYVMRGIYVERRLGSGDRRSSTALLGKGSSWDQILYTNLSFSSLELFVACYKPVVFTVLDARSLPSPHPPTSHLIS